MALNNGGPQHGFVNWGGTLTEKYCNQNKQFYIAHEKKKIDKPWLQG